MRKASRFPALENKTVWLFLGAFTLMNGLWAFLPLSIPWRIGLGVFGLVVTILLAFRFKASVGREERLFRGEFLTYPPLWVISLVILAAGLLRFIDLTGLSLWPLTDEAKSGYYSIQWASQGSVQLIYDFSQLPPLYIWLQGIFFKLFGVSLFSLWFFPALLSILTVALAYEATRVHFSKSFSLLFSGLVAFSFWPLYVGRFSHPGSLLLAWEFLVFWMAGVLARSSRARHAQLYGFLFGLLAGAGFYTFTSWPSVALVLILWVLVFQRWALPYFLAGMILLYLPWGLAGLLQGYGGYLRFVWALDPTRSWGPQILRGLWDLSAFFWRSCVPANLFAYKPFWGGYLNPLLGGAFFLGVLVFFRQSSKISTVFWTAAFLIFCAPGFLTGGLEMFRILPILPFLLAGVALGLKTALASLKASHRWLVLGLFLLASMEMDAYHLFVVYHRIWENPKDNWFASKSLDRLRAYENLQEIQAKAGPGLVLCSLVPDLYDQSLPLATYGFNTEENPGLDPAQAHWAALLTNIHYQPCLAKDFPEGRWIWLSPDMGWPDGGLMLGIIPLPSSNPPELQRILRADKAMQELIPMVFDHRDYRSRQPVIERLRSEYPLFQGDPYLESCFWEKIAENEYADGDYEAQVEALKQALDKGCPAAHLYNDLGALYLRRSRLPAAREAFEKALHSLPDHTSATEGLRLLEQVEESGKKPKD